MRPHSLSSPFIWTFLSSTTIATVTHELISPDGTIHPQDTGPVSACIRSWRGKKVYLGNSCSTTKKPFLWSEITHDDGSVQVKSQADDACWHVDRIDTKGSKLRLAACDANNVKQRFTFANGLIYHSAGNGKYCMALNRGSKLKMDRCRINRFGLISIAKEKYSFDCQLYLKTGDMENAGSDSNLMFNIDLSDGRTNLTFPLAYFTLQSAAETALATNTTTHYSITIPETDHYSFITRHSIINDMSGTSPEIYVDTVTIVCDYPPYGPVTELVTYNSWADNNGAQFCEISVSCAHDDCDGHDVVGERQC